VKAIKSDKVMSKKGVTPQNWRLKKGCQVFSGKNRGVIPSVAAPGVTHPSDATEYIATCTLLLLSQDFN